MLRGEEGTVLLDRFRLQGQVALVTGAGRGIGEGIAEAFAELGAHVICCARTVAEIEAVAGRIREQGGEATALRCDVTDDAQIEALIATTVERCGRLDVVVNNAGGGGWGPTLDLDDALLLDTLRLNLLAAVHVTRRAIPHMLAGGGGSVVNISSGMARVTDRGAVPYGAAKAGLEQATRMLAYEFAPRVRVNAIRCGAILTPDIEQQMFSRDPQVRTDLEAWTPMQRIGTPEDVALAALYLASDAGSYVTGKVLDVDGGVVQELSAMAIIRQSRER